MRITVVEDSNGKTCSIFEPGWIVTYSNESGDWAEAGRFENTVPNAAGMAGIRAALTGIVDGLKGKVLVASELSGIAYSVFENAGFTSFTTQAPAADVLDLVKAELEEMAKEKQANRPADIQTYLQKGPDRCILNLQQMLAENPQLTTKSVLLPYLREGNFSKLYIVFGHVPPWFDNELRTMGFAYETVDAPENKKTIRVTRMRSGRDGQE